VSPARTWVSMACSRGRSVSNGNVFMVPEAEYRSMQETAYLLRSPANARELRRSIAEAEAGQVIHPKEAETGGFE